MNSNQIAELWINENEDEDIVVRTYVWYLLGDQNFDVELIMPNSWRVIESIWDEEYSEWSSNVIKIDKSAKDWVNHNCPDLYISDEVGDLQQIHEDVRDEQINIPDKINALLDGNCVIISILLEKLSDMIYSIDDPNVSLAERMSIANLAERMSIIAIELKKYNL
jgi:hypothetical protein